MTERLSPERRAEIEKQALLLDSPERSEWKVAEVARALLAELKAVERERDALRDALQFIIDTEWPPGYSISGANDMKTTAREALAKLGGGADA